MNIFDAIFLSIIEGLTEFLPISSTGHMVIASYFIGIAENEFVKNFEVIIQFGAILAVVVIYKNRFIQSINFYKKLMIAFIPTGILGFLLKHKIDQWLESVSLVAWSLILGGIVLIWSDRYFEKLKLSKKSDLDLNQKELVYLGLWQSLALIPGVSRSGATIIGGLFNGMNRQSATEFSFFLAVPTMTIATIYKLLKSYHSITSDQFGYLALGLSISFVVAIFAVKSFIQIVSKVGFKYFGYYRIVLGFIILSLVYFKS